MASEYLKWLARNEKPEEKRQLTPQQKRRNWWHYHKWHVAIGVVVAAIVLDIAWDALGIGKVQPDCQIAYVGQNMLPEDTAAAVEGALAPLCGDLNGDGRCSLRLVQYPTAGEQAQATQIQLMADLLNCESYLFLLEDPALFQGNFHSLRRLDGTLPPEGDKDPASVSLLWEQCPALVALELGEYRYQVLGQTVSGDSQQLLAGLYIARRGFWTEKTVPDPAGCDAFWQTITEGALG